ncbi:MAG TPA: cofactor-independent phosphoglycerate mutase [Clostridiales bacterium]|nr:cofactor-independent phosphoglycerate mutase [Clostridiales bacterium]
MKYIFILADGMADRPSAQFDGKTPMHVADKPHINAMAAGGISGLCQTVPPEFSPGSDVANLSVLGYPPKDFYKGRSSLEAVSAGVPLHQGDLTLRANLVTLSEEGSFENKKLLDYCGGEVTTADAAQLIADVQKELDDEIFSLYPSVSFRNILLWRNGATDMTFHPAHEIMGKPLGDHLPEGSMADQAIDYMKKAQEILAKHPYNKEKIAKGERPANGLWLWGPGVKTSLPSFHDRYGLKAGVISGVDLIRGIGISAGMDICYLASATGGVETDFRGKGDVAAAYLKGGGEFIFVHVEAPDESGHQGKADMKVKAIERIDQETIPPILKACEDMREDYRIIVTPDHATPLELRTHTREPVPFVIFDSRFHSMDQCVIHDEESAKKSGILFEDGKSMLLQFLNQDYH